MNLYEIHLETKRHIVTVEVNAEYHDRAVVLAKKHMTNQTGYSWDDAHIGGGSCVGQHVSHEDGREKGGVLGERFGQLPSEAHDTGMPDVAGRHSLKRGWRHSIH